MKIWATLGILLAMSAVPTVPAQVVPESVYAFDIDVDETIVRLEPGVTEHRFEFTMNDESRDAPDAFTGGDTGAGVYLHRTSWSVRFDPGDDRAGWAVGLPAPMRTYGGESETGTFIVKLQPTVIKDPTLTVYLNATHKHISGEEYTEIPFTVISPGPDTYNALLQGAVQLEPNQIHSANIRLTNSWLLPREFVFELGENSCDLDVGYEAFRVVDAKTTTDVSVTILGPDNKFWYNSELCALKLQVFPADQTGNVRTLNLDPQITGIQVDPVWVFYTVAVILALIILFLLVARRKARIEEEILGRPQKPWHIPVEKVYLEHLKERDPQAHYVVRHYLMEEEYASSLLWYKDFKKATKGGRAKERLVVAQEHKVERFRKKWQRKIAAPLKSVARLEAKLQKKLDRKGRKGLREEKRKWKKVTKKMEASHAKKVAKAEKKHAAKLAKWEKAAAKAQKKGLDAPAKPEAPAFAEPDYPKEPSGDRLMLADHKWNAKVEKARAKAIKQQGNLEVKFEKKEAKLLKKVRKRVLKIARKLDDPEFEQEHPLLRRDESGA